MTDFYNGPMQERFLFGGGKIKYENSSFVYWLLHILQAGDRTQEELERRNKRIFIAFTNIGVIYTIQDVELKNGICFLSRNHNKEFA